ncbi:MAG: TRAP transporter large permease [Mobilitalea sp.]
MININVAIAILLLGFFVLVLLKVPITFSLILSSGTCAIYCGLGLMPITQQMVAGVNKVNLLAIPFFILAGEIMGSGGISQRLIKFSHALVGWMPGGLAHVNVLASMFFGGISGSAVADTSSIGAVLIPMMKEEGYDAEFAVGITVTSSCQGILIPPSHNMIMYAVCAGSAVSVGNLFLAGLFPGICLGISLMILSFFIAIKRKYPRGRKMTAKERLMSAVKAVPSLMTIVIIVGGVSGGIFTATESASIACIYAFILTFFVIREIKIKEMIPILDRCLRTLALVLSLIAAANAFAWMMTYLKVPSMLTNALLSISDNPYIVYALMVLLLLLLGCIMDMAPLILIMSPILIPVATHYGMTATHFGIVLIFSLAIGLCTPPVGSVLFVGCSIGRTKIEKTSVAMLPMFLTMVFVLILVTYIPFFTSVLPNLLG